MKVTHYQQMMAYLTRPGYDKGGKVLPKKKPQEEIKRRSRINYEKLKKYLDPESQMFIEKELGFAIGGSVETPKRGLVDEPGSYAGLEFITNPKRVGKDGGYRAVGQRGGKNFDEVFSVKKYGSKTKAKEAANKALEKWKKDNPIDPSKYKPLGPKPGTVIPQQIKQSKKQARELISARKKIDVWTESWVNNNIGKYKVKEYSKFEKDLKKAWKIESKKPMYNVGGTSKLLKKEGLPPVNASTQTTTINKKDVIVDNKNAFKPFGLNARVRQAKNPSSFFKKYFYAAQIEKNPNLKSDIIQYMDDVLVNKGRHAGVSQATVNAIYKRMGSNPDVVFLMSPGVLDTQNKNELFNKYFPKYNEYMEKVLIKMNNKLEKRKSFKK